MSFYLFQGKYTTASIKAMVDKPQDRQAGAEAACKAVGAKLHSFFFVMGENDWMAIVEAPDDRTMGALSLIVGASGGMSAGATTKLMTAAEAMEAMKMAKAGASGYRPPSN